MNGMRALPLLAPLLAGCVTFGSDRAFEDFARASYDLPPSTAAAWERSVGDALADAAPPRRDQVNPCDLLAADPADPQRVAAGVATAEIDDAAAEPACALAADLFSYDPRFGYQLARVYAKQGRLSEAQPLLQAAADAGYPAAQEALGALYLARGRSSGLNLGPAFDLLRAAGDGGAINAQYALGGLLRADADSVGDAAAESWAWTKRAAESGHPRAMTAYGRGILRGVVEAPQAEALDWFRRAADANEPEAMFSLAAALIQGTAAEPDPVAAFDPLMKAARWGHPGGQAVAAAALAGMGPYETLETERSAGAAYVWFDRAAASGVAGAADARDAIGGGLNDDQRAALDAASAAWRPGEALDLADFAALVEANPPTADGEPSAAEDAPPPS